MGQRIKEAQLGEQSSGRKPNKLASRLGNQGAEHAAR